MTPQAMSSILFDCVSQSSTIPLVGVVCGVAAYIASAVYIALRARYERSILAAVSSCLEADLQTRNASANAEMVRDPRRG